MFTVVLRTEDAFLVYRNASVAKLSGRHSWPDPAPASRSDATLSGHVEPRRWPLRECGLHYKTVSLMRMRAAHRNLEVARNQRSQ